MKRSQPRNHPPRLSPIRVPGRAGTAIQTFLVDTPAGVAEAADCIWAQGPGSYLYVDVEGHRLSRHGRISLLVLYPPLSRKVFVLDVVALRRVAFRTRGSLGATLQQILQSKRCKKVFFAVGNDAAALFHQADVALRNVEDVQLMERAVRPDDDDDDALRGRQFRGLAGCLEGVLSPAEQKEWAESKDAGKALFHPKSGGDYAVFNKRPVSPEILAYCVGDVYYLPRLRERYWGQLSEAGREKVREESKARVAQSQQKDDKPRSITKKSKSKSPRTDEFGRTADVQAKHREMEIEFGGLSVEWWDGLDDILAWEERHLH